MLGFLVLGALGGLLADRLREAGLELEERQSDLAALRRLHADIVASIGTGLMTTDLDGRVTFVNRAGLGLLAQDDEAVRGATAASLFNLSDDFLDEAAGVLREGRRYRFERHWRRDASPPAELFLGFSVSSLRGADEQESGWLIVFQDLTEIASLEEQVRTRERMAALGEMAAGIAHEIRNPLAAICGSVQVLHGGEPQSEEAAPLRDVVLREAERLNRTIKDFLRFARPGTAVPQACDLGDLMTQLARLLRKSPELRDDHRIDVVASPGVRRAFIDADAMRQVFWNLASNALRSMPDGGTLSVQVAGHGGDRVMVTFRDEGHGMDEETARSYFQPFRSRFQGGSGLGAAIVYRLVEEQGGQVQLVSWPGKGTEVRVILPAFEEQGVETAGIESTEHGAK